MEEKKTQTRKEVEAEIRLIKRWCRGPRIHSDKEVEEFTKQLNEAKSLDDLKSVKVKLEKKFKLPEQSVETQADAHNRILPLIHAYNDTVHKSVCGQDINDLIIKDGQFDGEDHELTCPRCGSKHVYSKLAHVEEAKAEQKAEQPQAK